MKKLFYTFAFTIFSLTLLFPTSSHAKVVTMERGAIEIPESEVVDDDLFAAGETVQIDGTINGDVYAAGETVRVNGTINGDLHAGAGMVHITGTVSEDVYAVAGNVNVSGAQIGDSLLVGAGNANIDAESSIGGSVLAGVGNLTLYSQVERNVMIGAGTVDLDSEIGGEARIAAGEISIGPNTQIAKDLHYAVGEEGKEANIAETASVAGQIRKYDSGYKKGDLDRARNQAGDAFKSFYIFTGIVSFIGALIVSFLWLRFFPQSLQNASAIALSSFWKSLGLGVVICLLAIPALIILAITGVGLPLAGILFLVLLLAIYLSKVIVGTAIGEWLSVKFNLKKPSAYLVIALGLVVVYILKMIAIVNLFAGLTILLAGVGAFFLSLKPTSSKK